jgi:hypothetical protein
MLEVKAVTKQRFVAIAFHPSRVKVVKIEAIDWRRLRVRVGVLYMYCRMSSDDWTEL